MGRSKLPVPPDGYTPAQRCLIDARLAEALKGPYYGPFQEGREVAAFLKKWKASSGKPAQTPEGSMNYLRHNQAIIHGPSITR